MPLNLSIVTKVKSGNNLRTNSVTYCLAKDMMPIYSVEKAGLETYWKHLTLSMNYQVENTFLRQLYHICTLKLESQLKANLAQLTISLLLLTCGQANHLSYTVHYIGDDWRLKTRCFQTLFLPQEHTGENIGDALAETLESWNLNPRSKCVSLLITDPIW